MRFCMKQITSRCRNQSQTTYLKYESCRFIETLTNIAWRWTKHISRLSLSPNKINLNEGIEENPWTLHERCHTDEAALTIDILINKSLTEATDCSQDGSSLLNKTVFVQFPYTDVFLFRSLVYSALQWWEGLVCTFCSRFNIIWRYFWTAQCFLVACIQKQSLIS